MHSFKIKEQKTVCEICPSENNGRNSEGDFITLNDSRIMFSYSRYNSSGSEDDDSCDIAALFSSDNGESFCDEKITLKAEDFGVKNLMSVTLRRMNNGDLGLFFLKKEPNGNSEVILCRSKDEGETFYKRTRCIPATFPSYYVMNNCRVLRTESGKWFIPVASHRKGTDIDGEPDFDYYAFSLLYFSEDDGETWNEIPHKFVNPAPHTETGLQEPGICELENGTLYAYFRTDCMCQYESFSSDGGKSWTTASPSQFTSPESPMLIRKNPYSGKYYAVYNPVPNYNGKEIPEDFFHGGRTPIVLRESENGIDFSEEIIAIEDNPHRGYCYPSMYFVDKNTMLLSFCAGGREDGSCLNKTIIKKIII